MGQRAAAMLEFAVAWPVTILVVLGCVQLAVWTAESSAVHAAALAGARAGAVESARPEIAAAVAVASLQPALVGAKASVWCPGQSPPQPTVWVCASLRGGAIEVVVRGTAPALVPVGLASGLPIGADVTMPVEVFTS